MNNYYINEETISNLRAIDESCNQSLLKELVKLFKVETPKRIVEIRRAAEEKNYTDLNRAAHTLKSGSAYLGADMIAKISKDIEMSASQNELPRNIETVINDLEHFTELANEYFNTKLAA